MSGIHGFKVHLFVVAAAVFGTACAQQVVEGGDDVVFSDEIILADDGDGDGIHVGRSTGREQPLNSGIVVLQGQLDTGPRPEPWTDGPRPEPWTGGAGDDSGEASSSPKGTSSSSSSSGGSNSSSSGSSPGTKNGS